MFYGVFPGRNTCVAFLLGDPSVRDAFMRHHADFFDPALWQRHKEQLARGELADFFPYDQAVRFCVRYPECFAQPGDAHSRAA